MPVRNLPSSAQRDLVLVSLLSSGVSVTDASAVRASVVRFTLKSMHESALGALQRAGSLPIWNATNTEVPAMMTREDRNAIDGLFQRLEEAERRGGPRDVEAEA